MVWVTFWVEGREIKMRNATSACSFFVTWAAVLYYEPNPFLSPALTMLYQAHYPAGREADWEPSEGKGGIPLPLCKVPTPQTCTNSVVMQV